MAIAPEDLRVGQTWSYLSYEYDKTGERMPFRIRITETSKKKITYDVFHDDGSLRARSLERQPGLLASALGGIAAKLVGTEEEYE